MPEGDKNVKFADRGEYDSVRTLCRCVVFKRAASYVGLGYWVIRRFGRDSCAPLRADLKLFQTICLE